MENNGTPLVIQVENAPALAISWGVVAVIAFVSYRLGRQSR